MKFAVPVVFTCGMFVTLMEKERAPEGTVEVYEARRELFVRLLEERRGVEGVISREVGGGMG